MAENEFDIEVEMANDEFDLEIELDMSIAIDQYLKLRTVAGQRTYTNSALEGRTIISVQYGNVMLADEQFTLEGEDFIITDESFDVEEDVFLKITYK